MCWQKPKECASANNTAASREAEKRLWESWTDTRRRRSSKAQQNSGNESLGYRSVDKYININTRADISMQTSFYFKGKKSPKKEKKKKKK
jgi:hypothetical protein